MILAETEYVVFADDSGNDPKEEWFLLAGWIATIPEWELFTEDWVDALKKPPAIDYFKHNEALAFKECFAGFSESEVDQKARSLVNVISRHNLRGVVVSLKHKVHQKLFVDAIASIDRRVGERHKHALYLGFHSFIPLVLQTHLDDNLAGKIDFVFDDGKKPSREARGCISLYDKIKDEFGETAHPYFPLMGNAMTGTDEEVKPLQAADFLAGQVRMSLMNDERLFPPLADMVEKRIDYLEMSEEMLKVTYPQLFSRGD